MYSKKYKFSTEEDVFERLYPGKCSMFVLTDALIELRTKQREEKDLEALYEKRQEILRALERSIEDLRKAIKNVEEQEFNFDIFLQDQKTEKAIEKAEREKQEVLQMKAELLSLNEEYAQKNHRKEELDLEIQRHSVYSDVIAQAMKMTEFKEVESLALYLRNLLLCRDKFHSDLSVAQKNVLQQRKTLKSLKDEFKTMQLEKYDELLQAQAEFDAARVEGSKWEKEWQHIQDTAAKKTLFVGQIKMGVLNLYEMTGGILEEEGVSINDTETQLEKIKRFIQDQEDLLKAAGKTEDITYSFAQHCSGGLKEGFSNAVHLPPLMRPSTSDPSQQRRF
ncbi:Coiled-coil domain-containing protein 42 [Channa argus]|uniref:Coiled-coil domain-containing protein 42 n=1 Tax=Channa argus TaxID=215402 RepID=A0A6G1QIJ5_CHAAH|nr:Coiled-coil domain-containing protein 42 [Channa argus]KAK2888611.1 hypothetical protein Q8A73_020059 [Channa argus]